MELGSRKDLRPFLWVKSKGKNKLETDKKKNQNIELRTEAEKTRSQKIWSQTGNEVAGLACQGQEMLWGISSLPPPTPPAFLSRKLQGA